MLALVAAPMRRTGALTVPDFAEARLGSPALRRLSRGGGAGDRLPVPGAAVHRGRPGARRWSAARPYWVGVVVAGAAVSVTLALGGMRAATYVQAFQFVLKLVLFIVPAMWLVLQVGPDTRARRAAPGRVQPVRRGHPGASSGSTPRSTLDRADHGADRRRRRRSCSRPAGTPPTAGSTWVFPAGRGGAAGRRRAAPGGPELGAAAARPGDAGYPLLATWSVLVATVLGTMGLPHILDPLPHQPGRPRRPAHGGDHRGAARRVLPVPRRLRAARRGAAAASCTCPAPPTRWSSRCRPGSTRAGRATLFTALLTAGAFAAFLATSLGPAARGVRGAVATTWCPARCAGCGSPRSAAAAVVVLLALPAARLDVGVLVTSAFAVAASTFCPLLVLGHLVAAADRARGAMVGMVVGLLALGRRDRGRPVRSARRPGSPRSCSASPRCGRCRWRSRRWCWCRCAAAHRRGRRRRCCGCTWTSGMAERVQRR